MTKVKLILIERAERKYGKISPCINKKHLDECFTEDYGKLIFWFNDKDQSTHVMQEVIKGEKHAN